MKSIKRGRGISIVNAIESAGAIIFGIIWISGVISIDAPYYFVLVGLLAIGLAIVQLIYHFVNATRKNRMSLYDITDNYEEDPFNQYFEEQEQTSTDVKAERYCPYCGTPSDKKHQFCAQCGKRLV